jgi:membrane-associated phospholipid phosphatase
MIFPVLAPVIAVFSISVIASTLFLKQHALADVLGGVAVATLSLMLSGGAHHVV